jgi:hypothetical protein
VLAAGCVRSAPSCAASASTSPASSLGATKPRCVRRQAVCAQVSYGPRLLPYQGTGPNTPLTAQRLAERRLVQQAALAEHDGAAARQLRRRCRRGVGGLSSGSSSGGGGGAGPALAACGAQRHVGEACVGHCVEGREREGVERR